MLLRQKIMKKTGLLLGTFLLAGSSMAQDHMQMREETGHVHLLTSCSPAVAANLDRGLSLFYSFWYEEARKAFSGAAIADPACAMAYWGQAMSEYQPVENLPEGTQLQGGREYLAKARAASEQTSRERGYIDALGRIFDTPAVPKAGARAGAYSEAMSKLHTANPDDSTAATLYALSLLSPELPDDPSLSRNRAALALLNTVLKQEPDNPGVMHFIIHASDTPALASYGLDAARRYARIAPASAHALHMPGHIFARLGLWQDDIKSNLASKAAAENNSGGMHTGAQHRLHAMEFLQYAYLQTGQDTKANALIQEAQTIKASDLEPGFEGYYGWVEASFKVRFALETEDWAGALKLTPASDAGPYVRRVDYWCQAIAAGHLHDKAAARSALSLYEATFIKAELADEESHSSAQLAEIRAWAAFASGDSKKAVDLLRPAAKHQDKMGKGEVELPAREMLADILRLSGDSTAAFTEYKVSLTTDPGRLSSLLHAEETAYTLNRDREGAALVLEVAHNTAMADRAVKAKLNRLRKSPQQAALLN